MFSIINANRNLRFVRIDMSFGMKKKMEVSIMRSYRKLKTEIC